MTKTAGIILSLPAPLARENGLRRYHVEVPSDWQTMSGEEIIVPIIDGPIFFEVAGLTFYTTSTSLSKEEIRKKIAQTS